MDRKERARTPAGKLLLAILVALGLSIPLFCVWLLVYDRENQSEQARASITEGWGGTQTVAGPELYIPFRTTVSMTDSSTGQPIVRASVVERWLVVAPAGIDVATRIAPERRSRSIYEVVIYRAAVEGRATFAVPADLGKLGIAPGALELDRAELRFGVSDARGLSGNPVVRIGGRLLQLGPGGGTSLLSTGFYAPVDLNQINPARFSVDFRYLLRGNESFALAPRAGETRWTVTSPWSSPSFTGAFLPETRQVGEDGFKARYQIGNLALGRSILFVEGQEPRGEMRDPVSAGGPQSPVAGIGLIEPVDLYSQVDRATKYGFLFIGFTFLLLLMFDVIAGVRVSPVEYLLMGAALVLFFVLLLALAEVIGFTPAYVVAAAAIAGLNTAYSAAVLKSWNRALTIGGLLVGLYAVIYVLLSLEAFSLLIGSLLLFVALAGVMYATRRIDWGAQAAARED